MRDEKPSFRIALKNVPHRAQNIMEETPGNACFQDTHSRKTHSDRLFISCLDPPVGIPAIQEIP